MDLEPLPPVLVRSVRCARSEFAVDEAAPNSDSAVAKAASVYIKKLAGGGGEKETKKRKAPTAKGKAGSKRSDRAHDKAVASDGSDEEDDSDSDL